MTIEQLLNWMRDNNATLSITKEGRESEGFCRLGNVIRLKVEIMNSDGGLSPGNINRVVPNYEWENTRLGESGSAATHLEVMMRVIDATKQMAEESAWMPTVE